MSLWPGATTGDLLLLSALKTVTVAVGFAIVFVGVKAWRSTNQRPLFWFTIGIAVLTLAAIMQGFAFQVLDWGLAQSQVLEAVVTLAGFLVLLYALYI